MDIDGFQDEYEDVDSEGMEDEEEESSIENDDQLPQEELFDDPV